MKLRKSKKGFTIVELVIVIAVIGVLTAILVPTFINLTAKANKASDQSLVSNLNTALKMQEAEDGEKNPTMHDAVLDLEEQGFKLSQLVTKSKEALLWNSETNEFELEKNQEGVKYWKIFQSQPAASNKFSVYAGHQWSGDSVELGVGFDAGYNTGITSVKYETSESQSVVIRTNGDQSVLTINAAQSDVQFYGFAKELNVTAVKGESLHIYGAASKLSVTAGHVEIEDTGIVFELAANTGTVTNNGYIETQTGGTAPTGTAVGGDYEIKSLARMEAFRDAVNSGITFEGKTVKLTNDITLKDGWTPIGEGCRQVVQNGSSTVATLFAGTFDGQNHTISNLNNKGFTPNSNRFDADKGCAYGLFALAGNGAEIKNIKLANVNIKFDSSLIGDSVAALVGYSENNIAITNVSVTSGTITASDAVAGILGRAYISKTTSPSTTYTVTISNCSNKANVTATDNKGGKSAGILAIASDISKGVNNLSLTLEACTNEGTILGLYSSSVFAYASNTRSNNYVMHNCSSNVVASGADKVTVIND